MSHRLLSGLILLSALGCGVVGGVFFAFSSFVMAALARLPLGPVEIHGFSSAAGCDSSCGWNDLR
jgi:uncharacterized membrane protein